uniref:AtzH-like domain-containing protein n=1 Tax=Aeromicrobium sp. REDSEA-S32_B7 TaxID=1811526 RepID=UPI000B045B5E
MSDDAPEGLLEAFWAYETALMSDDLETLDALFADRPDTLRGDAAGVLVGHETISRFRGSRGGAPRRTIAEVHVRVVDATHALVVAVTAPERGGRGPLVRPGTGPLSGESVAVKDLFAVAGQPVGAGNPTWAANAPVESSHAWAVQTLLGAGASVRGIARTDDVLVTLDDLNGLVAVDDDTGRVRVRAGTRLSALNPMLLALGLAMENLGDIDAQTVAGAISTSTHGTGLGFRSIAAGVVGLRLVVGDGSVVVLDDDHDPGLRDVARVGLGALGVITEVT